MKLSHVVIAAAVSMSMGINANAADRGKAYVSNQDGGVSVIDLNTLTSTTTIDVKGEGPRGLAVSDDGKLLVVATRENGSVSVIDTTTNEVLSQIKVGQNPEFVRIKGNFAFVSYEPSAKGGPPPAPGSAEAAAAAKEDDDDDKEPARIGIIDLKLGKKIREITGGPETEGVEFSKDGKQLVITNEADNTVTVHSMKSGKLLKTIKTHEYGDRPRGVKVSPDGKTYLVTLELSDKMLVLNEKFKVVKEVRTGKTPYGVSFDREGKRIFVAANKEKALQVFDAKTYENIKDIPTGERCWHFSFTPDDQQIMLVCGKSNEVVVIDANKLEVTKRIAGKGMHWGIVTYPKSMGSIDRP